MRIKSSISILMNLHFQLLNKFHQRNFFYPPIIEEREEGVFVFNSNDAYIDLGEQFSTRKSPMRANFATSPSWERCTRPSKGELTIPELFIAFHLLIEKLYKR